MALMVPSRSLLIALARAGVTIAAVIIIVSHIDFRVLLSHGHKLSALTLAISLALLACQTSLVAGLRLKLVLQTLGQDRRLERTVQVALSGFFFEQVAFGFVGGDAMRLWLLHGANIPWRTALQAIVVDRGLGSMALFLLAVGGLPGLIGLLTGYDWRAVAVAGAVAVSLGTALAIFLVMYLAKRARSVFLAELLGLALAAIREPGIRTRLAASFALALIAQSMNVVIFFMLGHDLAITLGFGYWFLIVPPALLISMLPISAGGWGLREASFAVALASFGIRPEEAIIPPILFGLGVLVVTLPGGIIWWAKRRRRSGREHTSLVRHGQSSESSARGERLVSVPTACNGPG
jgi:hypothetical protein